MGMIKTTKAQREAWKEKRRFKSWRDLLAKTQRIIRRSRRASEIEALFYQTPQAQACVAEIQNAIRVAN